MIKNHKKIAVLMATYNGERFLAEQLDSLWAQTYTDWALFVRDDGSQDATLSILSAYQATHNNLFILDNQGRNLHAKMNFMTLLEEVDSDFYMFIDQDDVWLPHKIEREMEQMQALNVDASTPALVFTNLQLVDERRRILSPSFWQSIGFSPAVFHSFRAQAYMGYVTGCTMLFNRRAKEVSLPIASYAPMHDWWVAVCIYKNGGKVGCVPEPQMLYRKHGANVTGQFVASQAGKSLRRRFQEMALQYRLMRDCGAVTGFLDYLRLKYTTKQQQKALHGQQL